jgi:hypothetical protein
MRIYSPSEFFIRRLGSHWISLAQQSLVLQFYPPQVIQQCGLLMELQLAGETQVCLGKELPLVIGYVGECSPELPWTCVPTVLCVDNWNVMLVCFRAASESTPGGGRRQYTSSSGMAVEAKVGWLGVGQWHS